jgi:hypothetical protein
MLLSSWLQNQYDAPVKTNRGYKKGANLKYYRSPDPSARLFEGTTTKVREKTASSIRLGD